MNHNQLKSFFLACLLPLISYGNIQTDRQGAGLPYVEESHPIAIQYREQFMQTYAIEQYRQKSTQLMQLKNNRIGLGLIKKQNLQGHGKQAFRDILRKTTNRAFDLNNISKTKSSIKIWNTGKQFLDRIVEYSSQVACIPKIVSVSHGWGARESGGDYHGLSGTSRRNGIYATPHTRPKGFSLLMNRTISKHMAKAIQRGQINFCNRCIIEFFACNVSTFFANTIAKTTGCQVVVATGKASPYYRKGITRLDKLQAWEGGLHWSSGGAFYGDKNSSWYRVTPWNTPYGETELVKENLGHHYLAL